MVLKDSRVHLHFAFVVLPELLSVRLYLPKPNVCDFHSRFMHELDTLSAAKPSASHSLH